MGIKTCSAPLVAPPRRARGARATGHRASEDAAGSSSRERTTVGRVTRSEQNCQSLTLCPAPSCALRDVGDQNIPSTGRRVCKLAKKSETSKNNDLQFAKPACEIGAWAKGVCVGCYRRPRGPGSSMAGGRHVSAGAAPAGHRLESRHLAACFRPRGPSRGCDCHYGFIGKVAGKSE